MAAARALRGTRRPSSLAAPCSTKLEKSWRPRRAPPRASSSRSSCARRPAQEGCGILAQFGHRDRKKLASRAALRRSRQALNRRRDAENCATSPRTRNEPPSSPGAALRLEAAWDHARRATTASREVLTICTTHRAVVAAEVDPCVQCCNEPCAAAEAHTLALSDGGAAFSWGSGLMGALGHGGRQDECAPRSARSLPFATMRSRRASTTRRRSAPTAAASCTAWGWRRLGGVELPEDAAARAAPRRRRRPPDRRRRLPPRRAHRVGRRHDGGRRPRAGGRAQRRRHPPARGGRAAHGGARGRWHRLLLAPRRRRARAGTPTALPLPCERRRVRLAPRRHADRVHVRLRPRARRRRRRHARAALAARRRRGGAGGGGGGVRQRPRAGG